MVRGGALIWPLLRALLDALREHLVARACVLGGCLCAALLLPAWTRPVVAVWGLGLMTMSILRVPSGLRAIRDHALLAAVTAMAALAILSRRFGGQLMPGLAQALVDLVDGSPNSIELLLRAYQAGLARLEGDLAMAPAMRLFNVIIMPPEVRRQLLYSLRLSVETLLRAYLPSWMMGWLMLTALLPALAADGYLRSAGRKSDLPPFERWYLPGRLAAGASVMLLIGLLGNLTQSAVAAYMGAMCGALGYWAWALQGACSLKAGLDQRGIRPVTSVLLIALTAAMLPLALFLIGCFDQLRDLRGLRGARDETH